MNDLADVSAADFAAGYGGALPTEIAGMISILVA